MAGRRKEHDPQSVTLDRFDANSQQIIHYLDEMHKHQKRCPKCMNLPGVAKEARPCTIMTSLAVWAASFWGQLDRKPQFEQRSLFDQSSDPWR